jgi:hypothetical protein
MLLLEGDVRQVSESCRYQGYPHINQLLVKVVSTSTAAVLAHHLS